MVEFGYLFDCEVMNEPGMNEGMRKISGVCDCICCCNKGMCQVFGAKDLPFRVVNIELELTCVPTARIKMVD